MTPPSSRRWRIGDHARGLVYDHGTVLVPIVVTAVSRRPRGGFAIECTYTTEAGEEATRVYYVDDNGRSDFLSSLWPHETQRAWRRADFYPRDVHVPPLMSTEHIAAEDKVIAATYRLGDCVWHIAEADSETGRAFGWAELAPGYGEWGSIDLRELEALCVGHVLHGHRVFRDSTTHGQRFADHIH